MIMRDITISNLRNRINYFFNLVTTSSEVLIIPMTNTDDAVVILSLKEYYALTETNYLMSSEANRQRLLESIAQLAEEKTK
ncbi:MAG: type II toxin-antitoxin system Phd/YefM family antitoxin [Saprospiraceae bacterium]|nr:type II toxin-antitoxin system Phd/YefM family antitoxin [Candidatus Opimibacter iunctus]